MRAHLKPLPGVMEWVGRLRQQGWRQAVASSAPRKNIEVVLEVIGMAGFFDALVSAEDVTAGKPDPQVFQKGAERLGMPASRCIVVEDAVPGVEAARRAGMRCIGVSRKGVLTGRMWWSGRWRISRWVRSKIWPQMNANERACYLRQFRAYPNN